MSSETIFTEIWTYFEFHNQIQKYFNEGFNDKASNKIQQVYLIDSNWIKAWKKYSNYENIITLQKNYKFLKKINFLNYNKKHGLEELITGNSDSFLNKAVHKITDFDCLVDEMTYKLFKRYKSIKNSFKFDKKYEIKKLECAFYKKSFIIISENQKVLKLFSKYIKEPHDEVIQLTFDFYFNKFKQEGTYDIVKDVLASIARKNSGINYIYIFTKKYLSNNDKEEKLLDFLTKTIEIDKKEEGNFNLEKKIVKVKNNNLIKKIVVKINDFNTLTLFLKNVNNPRLIGLENIGATCYMNSTLQCLVNIKDFTNYLLNNDNFTHILKNIDNCELLGSYCKLLSKLCCDESVINYYAPRKFKQILSLKNPLFEGVQANDSKDLIYFLLEQFNEELNIIDLKLNPNLKKDENLIDDINQTNKNLVFSNFIREYTSDNNNIIPKLFFSLIENESLCNGCQTRKYNYQIVFSLEMPLEMIYNKIYGNQNINQNMKKKLNLNECFMNYNEYNIFTGENAMYCNICQRQMDSSYYKKLYSPSPILIIILNRGKANKFDCDVDFDEQINLQPYLLDPSINYSYKLFGVVTHFGTSDMGGHFIAYCRHRILNEWYCYNDAVVTKLSDQQNGYKNGVPYILFYESEQGNKNILFDNNLDNIPNNLIQNSNQNLINNNFMFNNFNNMNNMNFQNNINIMTNFMNNIDLNSFNNNFQNNNNNQFLNSNMNNNLNMMTNNMNFNMNMHNNNMNIINSMNNNINNNINMNNINNNNFIINNNDFNNLNNNINNNMANNMNNNFNIINSINNNPQSNNNINTNNIQNNTNIINNQMNNPNMNFTNIQINNNMNNNY